ncbi:MAG: hypothetical protein WDO15_08545 [Bacteroidota bacterium]
MLAKKNGKELAPARPFNYSFLDDQYDALYRTEQRVSTLVTVFCIGRYRNRLPGLFGIGVVHNHAARKGDQYSQGTRMQHRRALSSCCRKDTSGLCWLRL